MRKLREEKSFIKSGIITIVFSIFVAALVYYFISNALATNLTEALTEIATQGSKAVSNEIQGRLNIVEAIANGNTIIDPEISMGKKLEKLRRDVKRQDLVMIAIADKDGNSITTDGLEVFIGDREYFKRALSGYKNISEPIVSKIDDALVISYAVPITHNEDVTGVLFSVERIEELSSVTDSVVLGDYGESFIVDGEGTIIAHKNRQLVKARANPIKEREASSIDKSMYKFFQKLMGKEKGGGQYFQDGAATYAGYSKIIGTDWTFIISAPKKQAFRSIEKIYYYVIIILLLVLILFLAAWIYIKYLRQSLEVERTLSDIAVDAANLLILSISLDGRIHDYNKYAEMKLGYSKSEVMGKMVFEDIIDRDYEDKYVKFMEQIFNGSNVDSYELPLIDKDKNTLYIFWNTVFSTRSNIETINMIGIDLTEEAELTKSLAEKHNELAALYEELYASEETLRQNYDDLRESQERIHELAYYDSLTGLSNKIHLENIFNEKIKGKDEASALLFLDIDDFKYVNDILGHKAGDILLKKVAERIEDLSKENSWVSRLGGDEFMILIKDFYNIYQIELWVEKLMRSIESDFYIKNMSVNISFSMGIAVYPDHGETLEDLMRSADIAMYVAKEAGKGTYKIFTQAMNDKIVRNVIMEKNMRKGMENGEFLLYYQPQWEIDTNKIRGFEALLRWRSPEHGFVSPLEFIKIAETSGMILPLGKWVIEEACDFIKKVRDDGFTDLKVAVNISVLQIMQDDFIDMVIDILDEKDLEPSCLEIEITETILMEFHKLNIEKIKKLNNLGVNISLDDFGTGYSSLTYLRELPIDVLKIDKSFIDEIAFSSKKSDIIGSVIFLAHNLGLKVVAEGVETKEQLRYISYHKCDIAQGYLLSKPIPEDEAIDFLYEKSQDL